ncbi:MAG: ParB/RepB/Spo0J family partition protein [Ruminococcus sp.]|jgi:ParB family chromosome partitioning protein|nr:ParB/RepB/Spo0J family partition protein [Ruminococcus sp.]
MVGGLGAGLDTLFSDNTSEVQIKKTLRLSEIEPNREQPRKNFSDEAIASLADSIREHGVLQPILVRPMPKGGYQIVAGERRWRAARMVGLNEIPVTIKELSDIETMQIAVIENLQRENLDPVEEAMGYNELIEKFGMTQDKVAKMVGKSRSAIANSVRILSLPDEVLKFVQDGQLSLGHAKALLSISDEKKLIEFARKAADGGMTVRQLEKIAQKLSESNNKKNTKSKSVDNYFVELEVALNEKLGRKVKVEYGKNKGTLMLEFYDKDDLKAIADMLYNEE